MIHDGDWRLIVGPHRRCAGRLSMSIMLSPETELALLRLALQLQDDPTATNALRSMVRRAHLESSGRSELEESLQDVLRKFTRKESREQAQAGPQGVADRNQEPARVRAPRAETTNETTKEGGEDRSKGDKKDKEK